MTPSVHARCLSLATEVPYRHAVLQLQSQIVQVRIRSHHIARQLSCLTHDGQSKLPLSSPGRIAIRYTPFTSGVGTRRYYSEKPIPKDQPNVPASSSIEPKPATSIPPLPASDEVELHESPYTIPNALTLARILACPFLGYTIVDGDFAWATGILFASGLSDWLDGWLARRYNSRSVLGSILDPAADKALMTTLVGTLAWSGLLPLPLAILIFGRDLGLSISAFYFRFISLPKPRTLKRYFDVSIPSAEVKPTQISKINTALQLLLMGLTTVSPLLGYSIAGPLQALQWTVAGTTIWSGFSYIGRSGVKILQQPGKKL
ncbi:uncharacterized protein I303_101367 [Kwoniella dejecticola CBS 10117]|uniref:Cardiolipin synthase n=1 Tax=Kwoniella dejecticola CBS 10117 TaxID=1296121 RepID=A0A1A6AHQ7_9TREE|nr:cardiolipin synthase [Kwoniella dejecticola CBS 10117]OBR89548.1 cardiolipin synthase [Kwoniella dejecticola CBS 10117]